MRFPEDFPITQRWPAKHPDRLQLYSLTTPNGVKIVGHLNVPGRLAATSSALYAKNLFAFLETMVDKAAKALAVKWDDELVKATNLTRDGAVVHPNFQPKTAETAA